MPEITWDETGSRIYETGIDRGVLYVGELGVAWNGLTSVEEHPSGGSSTPYYIDGVKYLNIPASEEFEATINAFTYPDEFGVCDGSAPIRPGFFAMNQRRRSFGLSYRTLIGNDLAGPDFAYKIHLVYNALAAPSQRSNSTMKDSTDPTDFSWDVTTVGESITGFKNTAYLVVDSRHVSAAALAAIEDALYGSDTQVPRLPSASDIAALIDNANTAIFVVTDMTGGAFQISSSDAAVTLLGAGRYQLTSNTVVTIDADSASVSSS